MQILQVADSDQLARRETLPFSTRAIIFPSRYPTQHLPARIPALPPSSANLVIF